MSFEWDPNKAAANVRKHGVQFTEALGLFSDDYAITIEDHESSRGRAVRYYQLGNQRARSGGCVLLQREEHPNHLGSDGRTA